MKDLLNLPDGFYWMRNPSEPRPSLVRVYTVWDAGEPLRGVGFGIWDGAAFLPDWDIKSDSTFTLAVADPEGYDG